MVTVTFRPLLTSGTLATDAAGRVHLLVDNEQSELEQLRALCHELMHLVGIEDEDQAEILGRRIAEACPELLAVVKAAHA